MSAEYRKLMEERERINGRHKEEEDAIKTGFVAELTTAYKVKFPKRKFSESLSFKNNPEEHKTIFDKWQAKATALMGIQSKEREELRNKMKVVALTVEIPIFNGMTLFKTVSSSDYRSQGFGEHKYARSSAEDYLDKAKSYGLDACIREVLVCEGRDTCGYSFRVVDYEVWVATDEVGVEILGHKPYKGTDVEWAKKCRDRGVNIRVYLPFLSYEESERLEKGA